MYYFKFLVLKVNTNIDFFILRAVEILIYPTKKETHTVAFSDFLENDNTFSFFYLHYYLVC